MATTLYKLLMQFSAPKGIRVEIDRSMWPKADGLPEKVQGRVEQWVNKAKMQLKITWVEPSGKEKFDVDALHDLLPHNFKLVLGPRGEKLLLRGAARFEAAAATNKETIESKYKEGGRELVMIWVVEPNPEAVHVDARTEARFKASLNRRCRR